MLDFGIAFREGETQLTRTGMVVGTPGYMAPEQARNGGEVDARADVFALGCVLFMCLTGTPAFEGDTAASILTKIVFGETPRVSALWPEVPAELDALVVADDGEGSGAPAERRRRPGGGAGRARARGARRGRVAARARRPAAGDHGRERRFLAVVLLGPPAGRTEAELAAEPALEALRRASKPSAAGWSSSPMARRCW